MAPGARVTGNLPAELTSFVGRRGEPASSRLTSASSPRRPTKLVSSAGRFPVTRAPVP